METKLGQEPAFATSAFGNGESVCEVGMSKRLYIATSIAQGLCGNSNHGVNTNKAYEFAKICYRLADELLKQENL